MKYRQKYGHGPKEWQAGYDYGTESIRHETRAQMREALRGLSESARSDFERGMLTAYEAALGTGRSHPVKEAHSTVKKPKKASAGRACASCKGTGSIPVPANEPGRFGKATHLVCAHCGGSGKTEKSHATAKKTPYWYFAELNDHGGTRDRFGPFVSKHEAAQARQRAVQLYRERHFDEVRSSVDRFPSNVPNWMRTSSRSHATAKKIAYRLKLTPSEMRAVEFAHGRYSWPDMLAAHAAEDGSIAFTESEMWQWTDDVDADTEGGHSPFPLASGAFADKLQRFYDERV